MNVGLMHVVDGLFQRDFVSWIVSFGPASRWFSVLLCPSCVFAAVQETAQSSRGELVLKALTDALF